MHYLDHPGKAFSVNPAKIEEIKEWPVPKDKQEIRSFLGLYTYYRRFVLGFADIAKLLIRQTEEGRNYEWDREY